MNDNTAIQLSGYTEVTTNINVKSDKHQLIYTSQLYETFFIVSCKFILSSDQSKLESMALKLINYKGHLNIGLLESTRINLKPDSGQSGRWILELQLKAMEGVHGHSNELELKNLDIDLVHFQQLLTTRKLHRFGPTQNIADHLNDMVFDSEFFERDGAVIREKKTHLDHAPVISSSPGTKATLGGKCKTTLAFIISN